MVVACVVGQLASCAVVGPHALRNGRLVYNAAITETNNQQILVAILQQCYEESGSLLAVSSVTANVSVTTTAGIQAGFGDSDDYEANLVPFSAGTTYEENPTISYRPVEGVQYLRKMMSPVSVAMLAQLAGSMNNPAPYLNAIVSSVNGIHNPEFERTSDPRDPRFARFVALVAELTGARRLHWLADPSRPGGFAIVLDRSASGHAVQVDELLEVLGLPPRSDLFVTVPVILSLQQRDTDGIALTTRSVWALIEILAAAVDVPERDRLSGAANTYPPLGAVGKDLRIQRSESRPQSAAVAVEYRRAWYFIDDRDLATKRIFKLLGALWSSTMAETSAGSAAPVLTVPVSR